MAITTELDFGLSHTAMMAWEMGSLAYGMPMASSACMAATA